MIEFTLPPAQVISSNDRGHWTRKATKVRAIRETAGWAYRSARSPRYASKVHCVCSVAYPDRRRRDAHNYVVTAKPAIDAMTALGLLPDDNDKWLVGPDMRASGQPSTDGLYHFRFEFTPVDGSAA